MATIKQLLKISVAVVLFIAAHTAYAGMAGSVLRVTGDAQVANIDGSNPRPLSSGDMVQEGEQVMTNMGNIQMQMKDGAIIALTRDSVLMINAYKYDEPTGEADNVSLRLEKGSARTISGNVPSSAFAFMTPHASIKIHGTLWDTKVGSDSIIIIREGAVTAESTCSDTATGDQQLINVPGTATVIQACLPPSQPIAETELDDNLDNAIVQLDAILPITTASTTTDGPTPPGPDKTPDSTPGGAISP